MKSFFKKILIFLSVLFLVTGSATAQIQVAKHSGNEKHLGETKPDPNKKEKASAPEKDGSKAAEPAAPVPEQLPSPLEKLRFQILQVTKRSVLVRDELKELKKSVPTKEVLDRIEALQKELDSLNQNFETLATQLHATEIPKPEALKTTWLDELNEITRPILDAVREITQRPRRIDNLKARIDTLQNQILRYQEARKNLGALLQLNGILPEVIEEDKKKDISEQQLKTSYKENLQRLVDKYNPEILQLELEETRRTLRELQTDGTTVFSVVSESVGEFFKERGYHFTVALFTFLGLWWGLALIYTVLNERTKLLSRVPRSIRKIFKTAYNIIVFLIAVLASLTVLYLMDDWLLLSFFVLFLMALGWTSRQLIPQFLQELRLILNFGTVREGERMFWKGVPWLVKEIGFHATLMNPRLDGGMLYLPVGELIGQHSRPFVKDEEWFPTNQGDWVFLSDDVFGKVLSQTPEQVILEHYGSRKYYLTPEFLTMKPRNISSGFALVVKFGLDYAEQGRICEELPELFRVDVEKHTADLQEQKPPVFDLIKVQFSDAGASSLNLILIAMVNGTYAQDYFSLQRRLNNIMVQTCNENNLVIPFNQMTLSLSPDTIDLVNKNTEK